MTTTDHQSTMSLFSGWVRSACTMPLCTKSENDVIRHLISNASTDSFLWSKHLHIKPSNGSPRVFSLQTRLTCPVCSHWLVLMKLGSIYIYRNFPKVLDRQVWVYRSSLIRVYTVCHSVCIVWTHYSMVEPHSSNFRVIITNVLVSEYLGNLRYIEYQSWKKQGK